MLQFRFRVVPRTANSSVLTVIRRGFSRAFPLSTSSPPESFTLPDNKAKLAVFSQSVCQLAITGKWNEIAALVKVTPKCDVIAAILDPSLLSYPPQLPTNKSPTDSTKPKTAGGNHTVYGSICKALSYQNSTEEQRQAYREMVGLAVEYPCLVPMTPLLVTLANNIRSDTRIHAEQEKIIASHHKSVMKRPLEWLRACEAATGVVLETRSWMSSQPPPSQEYQRELAIEIIRNFSGQNELEIVQLLQVLLLPSPAMCQLYAQSDRLGIMRWVLRLQQQTGKHKRMFHIFSSILSTFVEYKDFFALWKISVMVARDVTGGMRFEMNANELAIIRDLIIKAGYEDLRLHAHGFESELPDILRVPVDITKDMHKLNSYHMKWLQSVDAFFSLATRNSCTQARKEGVQALRALQLLDLAAAYDMSGLDSDINLARVAELDKSIAPFFGTSKLIELDPSFLRIPVCVETFYRLGKVVVQCCPELTTFLDDDEFYTSPRRKALAALKTLDANVAGQVVAALLSAAESMGLELSVSTIELYSKIAARTRSRAATDRLLHYVIPRSQQLLDNAVDYSLQPSSCERIYLNPYTPKVDLQPPVTPLPFKKDQFERLIVNSLLTLSFTKKYESLFFLLQYLLMSGTKLEVKHWREMLFCCKEARMFASVIRIYEFAKKQGLGRHPVLVGLVIETLMLMDRVADGWRAARQIYKQSAFFSPKANWQVLRALLRLYSGSAVDSSDKLFRGREDLLAAIVECVVLLDSIPEHENCKQRTTLYLQSEIRELSVLTNRLPYSRSILDALEACPELSQELHALVVTTKANWIKRETSFAAKVFQRRLERMK